MDVNGLVIAFSSPALPVNAIEERMLSSSSLFTSWSFNLNTFPNKLHNIEFPLFNLQVKVCVNKP